MRVSVTVAWIALVAAAVLVAWPAPGDPALMHAAALVVLSLGLWSTGALPEYLTSVVFFLGAVLLAVAPPEVVFSGFHSGAVWLIFGGLVIGVAVQQTGLGARVVRLILTHVPVSYPALVIALAVIGTVLSFLIPSALARMMLLMPIVLALADRLGFAHGSRGRIGLVLAVSAGNMIPAPCILPANVPNIVMVGAAESGYGVTFNYGSYLALNFPVMGVLGLALAVALILVMFPDHPRADEVGEGTGEWTQGERRLLIVLGAALALWMTDFLHGIAPAWVAMAAALACLLPRVGMLPPDALAKQVNYGPWIFVAGIIGVGAVVTSTGLGDLVGGWLLGVVPLSGAGDFERYGWLVAIGIVVVAVTTLPAAPAIMTPLAGAMATASGWPIDSVLMAQVPSWVFFPFPYVAPPLVVAMALGGIPVGPVLRFFAAFTVTGLLLLAPLHFYWARLLGYFSG